MSTATKAGAAVSTVPEVRSLLSQIHPDFAPLVPAVNEAFKRIWKFETIEEFRSHWTTTRASFPQTVPSEGFVIETDVLVVSDGTAIEVCIHRPTEQEEEILPVLFVLHGGGTWLKSLPKFVTKARAGWVGGSHATEAGMSRSICVKTQVVIVSVDYRK
jgi:acetyl esterase/lipase